MNQDTKFVIGIVISCVLIFAGAIFYSNKAEQAATTPVDEALLVREDSQTIEGDGPVTLVEFIDPQCGACASYHPLVKQVIDNYEGELTYVLRYFPFQSNSLVAARSLEAAGEQEKYWEMLDVVFENQSEWAAVGNQEATDLFASYAEALELDMEQFKEAVESDRLQEKVARDRADAIALGVQATPTFFVNGVQLQNNPRSAAQLQAIIDAAKEETSTE